MLQATLHSEHSAPSLKLLGALELGGTHWGLTAGRGGTKITETRLVAGDLSALERAIATAKARHGLPATAPTVVCYEAGRDGFWLQRELERRGMRCLVVDSASIEVPRRARRAKTDRLDGRKLLAMLYRYDAGEVTVWRVVRVPTVAQEDARRPQRELERLTQERAGHVSRIRALLALHGVQLRVGPNLPSTLATVTVPDSQRRQRTTEEASPAARQVRHLTRLKGIGDLSAWLMVQEVFAWRRLRNRREAAALVGLTPTPYASAGLRHEQGISKAGNRHVRRVLIQLAWGWLRYQPGSALSRWFHQRFGHGGRLRRIGIVALARRLFIALWRFVEDGLVPDGAALRAA